MGIDLLHTVALGALMVVGMIILHFIEIALACALGTMGEVAENTMTCDDIKKRHDKQEP